MTIPYPSPYHSSCELMLSFQRRTSFSWKTCHVEMCLCNFKIYNFCKSWNHDFCFSEMINLQCIFIQSTEKRLPLILMIHAWLPRCTWIRKVFQKKDKYNILGVEWCTSFLKRHKDLTKGFACNTKTEHTAISEKTIKQYASDLENEVHGVYFVHWPDFLFVDPSGVKLWLFSHSICLIFNL